MIEASHLRNEERPCPECEGDGVTITPGCCYDPTPYGSCCGNPVPIYNQCQACYGTGVVVTEVEN